MYSTDTMASPDYPSLCSKYCCCCIQICCPREKKKRFAGHEYKLVHTSPKEPSGRQLPFSLQKSFTLPQAKADFPFPFHSQRSAYISRRATPTVTEQPRLSPRAGTPHKRKVARSHSLREYLHSPSPVRGKGMTERGVHQKSASPTYPQSPVPTISTTSAPHKHHLETSIKGVVESASVKSKHTMPEILFSLYYSIQAHSLTVHLESARHLPHKRKKGYLIHLYLVPHRGETLELHVRETSASPHINQSLKFTGFQADEVRSQTLVMLVYHGVTKDEQIGGIVLPLREADLHGVKHTMHLDPDAETMKTLNKGDLLLSLKYNPTTNTLQGVVLKVTNLKQHYIIGLADPYVKIWLLYKGRRIQKWRSSVKQNTLTPIFNEAFQFDIASMNMKDITLEILIMDYDRFSRDEVTGVIYAGRSVPHQSGREHWDLVISQPKVYISHWHPIVPVAQS